MTRLSRYQVGGGGLHRPVQYEHITSNIHNMYLVYLCVNTICKTMYTIFYMHLCEIGMFGSNFDTYSVHSNAVVSTWFVCTHVFMYNLQSIILLQ